MVGKRDQNRWERLTRWPKAGTGRLCSLNAVSFLGSSWWAALPNFFEISLPWALSRTPKSLHVRLGGHLGLIYHPFHPLCPPPPQAGQLPSSAQGWRDISHWCLSVTSVALEGSIGQKDAWIQDKELVNLA